MFSLIVCTVDRFDQLERLFGSLARQTLRTFEIILVDQNEDDRLFDLVERFASSFPIHHLRSGRGLSHARNNGIAKASGTYVCFPDDDCWYEPATLEIAARLFRENSALSIVTGRTLDADGKPSVSPTGDRSVEISRRTYLRCGNSNGIFVRRETLCAIGGFDENLGVGSASPFQSGEEADLLLRFVGAGQKLMYFPELIVHHDQVVSVIGTQQIERARKYGRGFGALLRKHDFSLPYVTYRIARPAIGWLVARFRFNADEAAFKRAWLKGIVEGYKAWPKWNGVDQSLRTES